MKKCLIILAIMSLTACSSMPAGQSSQTEQVEHPDVFHSYID
jgi:uncharacterized protein YcfL